MMTRTTIRISQSVLDKVKERALKGRRSLAAEMEDLLRFAVAKLEEPRPPVQIPVLTRGADMPPLVDLTKTSDLLELTEEDDDSYRRQRSS